MVMYQDKAGSLGGVKKCQFRFNKHSDGCYPHHTKDTSSLMS